MRSLSMAALFLALAQMPLAGCVVAPPPGPPAAPVYYVPSPPPAPIVEYPGYPPGPGHVWHPGHWRWNGHEYFWTRGTWVAMPPQAVGWVAPRWEYRPQGWVFIEGRWH